MSSSSPWSVLEIPTDKTMSYSRKVFKKADEVFGNKPNYRQAAQDDSDAFGLVAWLRLLPRRPRKVLLAVVTLFLLVLFVHNIPTEVHPERDKINRCRVPEQIVVSPPPHPVSGFDAPTPLPGDGHHPNGPIKFYSLAKSLYFANGRETIYEEDNLVLFAAADLKCASDLLNLACEMARNKVNRVHFALMGRDTVSIEGIQEVNGIREAACPLVWHGELLANLLFHCL